MIVAESMGPLNRLWSINWAEIIGLSPRSVFLRGPARPKSGERRAEILYAADLSTVDTVDSSLSDGRSHQHDQRPRSSLVAGISELAAIGAGSTPPHLPPRCPLAPDQIDRPIVPPLPPCRLQCPLLELRRRRCQVG